MSSNVKSLLLTSAFLAYYESQPKNMLCLLTGDYYHVLHMLSCGVQVDFNHYPVTQFQRPKGSGRGTGESKKWRELYDEPGV